jgi:hypothetical protein
VSPLINVELSSILKIIFVSSESKSIVKGLEYFKSLDNENVGVGVNVNVEVGGGVPIYTNLIYINILEL